MYSSQGDDPTQLEIHIMNTYSAEKVIALLVSLVLNPTTGYHQARFAMRQEFGITALTAGKWIDRVTTTEGRLQKNAALTGYEVKPAATAEQVARTERLDNQHNARRDGYETGKITNIHSARVKRRRVSKHAV